MIVEAKARANPASEALIVGEATATKPVTPMIPLEMRLKRTESHRLTEGGLVSLFVQCPSRTHTSPHPIVRIRVLKGW